jgi:MFS family permease
MIFAVAMTFIDQTIVSIAVPNIQRELSLSSTQVQWVVNGYLLALAAFFALGGRLGSLRARTWPSGRAELGGRRGSEYGVGSGVSVDRLRPQQGHS